MGDLTANFSRAEFACGCGCGYDTVDYELLKILELIREHFDRPVDINSGCRCVPHNRACNGSDHSQHLLGRAADIVVREIPAEIVQEFVEQIGAGGLGRYDAFTHVDTRIGYARW